MAHTMPEAMRRAEPLPGWVEVKSMAQALRLIDDWIAESDFWRRRCIRAEHRAISAETRYTLAYYAALHQDELAIEALRALAPVERNGSPDGAESLKSRPGAS